MSSCREIFASKIRVQPKAHDIVWKEI